MWLWLILWSALALVRMSTKGEALVVDNERSNRRKRCACSDLLDHECIYFCHLDIIWIRKSSQLVPFGIGSHVRTRRGALGGPALVNGARCMCNSKWDQGCAHFCMDGSSHPDQLHLTDTGKSARFLHGLKPYRKRQETVSKFDILEVCTLMFDLCSLGLNPDQVIEPSPWCSTFRKMH
uniref:endothelin-2-like n=1 Tax=Myxine glutinosa TaxID=7769 RepID=UPI00358EB4F3